MGFDFVILVFTIVALYFKHRTCSDLWHLLFRDGLLYFVVTFLCNALPAVSVFIDVFWRYTYRFAQVFNVLQLNGTPSVLCAADTCWLCYHSHHEYVSMMFLLSDQLSYQVRSTTLSIATVCQEFRFAKATSDDYIIDTRCHYRVSLQDCLHDKPFVMY